MTLMPTETRVPRSKRPRIGQRRRGPARCVYCAVQIPDDVDHVVVYPCECTACPKCLLKAHAKRGVEQLKCPCTPSVKVTSHQIIEAGQGAGEVVDYATPNNEYIETNLPLTYLKRKLGQQLKEAVTEKEAMVLYCGTIQKKISGVSGVGKSEYTFDAYVKAIMLDLHGSSYTNEVSQRLCEFFGYLYPRIVPPSQPPRKTQIPVLSP